MQMRAIRKIKALLTDPTAAVRMASFAISITIEIIFQSVQMRYEHEYYVCSRGSGQFE